MRGFIIKTVLFSILIFSLISLLSANISISEEADYITGGILLKHKRLDSLKRNKVIFAGGSNLAFGINSKRIQDSIKIPVVNQAIHGGLGLDFILNEIKLNVKAGDIVFLSPEYYLGEGRYDLKKTAASYYSPANNYFEHSFYEDLINFVDTKSTQIKINKNFVVQLIAASLSGTPKESSVYSSTSFNQYGDVVAHLNRPSPPVALDKITLEYKYWDGIQKINALAQELKAKDVQLYFLYPAFSRKSYDQNKESIMHYQADLSKDLKVPIINTPEDFLYDDDLLFDTVYHLKGIARENRTSKLIEIIKQRTTLFK